MDPGVVHPGHQRARRRGPACAGRRPMRSPRSPPMRTCNEGTRAPCARRRRRLHASSFVPSGSAPRCVSRRVSSWIAGGRPDRRRPGLGTAPVHRRDSGAAGCLERQGAIVALPTRFGLEPFVLHDVSCVSQGRRELRVRPLIAIPPLGSDHHRHGVCPRTGLGARLGPPFVLLLGTLTASRLLSGRALALRTCRARHAACLLAGVSSARRGAHGELDRARGSTYAPSRLRPRRRPTRRPILEPEGDVWRVTYQGTTIRIRHSRGMALLSHLLRNPGEELHVQALDALVPSAGGGTNGRRSTPTRFRRTACPSGSATPAL